MKQMQIYFAYDKKLAIQALRYHFINRNEIKILLVVVNVFAFVAAILLSFRMVSPIAFLLSSLLWLALMASFWMILPYSVYKRTPTFKDVFTMIFFEQYIKLENEKGFIKWEWKQFSTFIESPHFFHLYFNSKSFFLVPKAAVEKDGEVNELRKLLKEKIIKR